MSRVGIFLLVLIACGLGVLGYWLANRQEEAPSWQQAYRESRIVQPEGRGARIDAVIRMRGSGGTSLLAQALARGATLQISGTVSAQGADLLFRLRGGQGEAVWRQLQSGSQAVLAIGGVPYRSSPRTFLEIDWPQALRPRPLLRAWPRLDGSRSFAAATEEWSYRYTLGDVSQKEIVGGVPLLRALVPGKLGALVSRASGAPGGIVFSKTIRGKKISGLLGVSRPLDLDLLRVDVRYEVLLWKNFPAPRVPAPASLRPAGRAALEVALLPFFVGLQGGQPNS